MKFRRGFTTFKKCLNKVPIPDNAPTLEENVKWINQISRAAAPSSEVDPMHRTYCIVEKDEASPRLFHEVAMKIVKKANKLGPFITLEAPANNFFVPTSPFAHATRRQRPKVDTSQSFTDIKLVKLRSGKGGNGHVSFLRDANRSRGPPNGGDGGSGGDVYVKAVSGMRSLHKLRSKYLASDGEHGAKDQLDGKRGSDIVIEVPVGTLVRWCPDPRDVREWGRGKSLEKKYLHLTTMPEHSYESVPSYIQFFRKAYDVGSGWIFKDKDEEYHLAREYFSKLNKKVSSMDNQLNQDELEEDIFPLEGLDLPVPTDTPFLLLKGGRGGLGNMHFLTPEVRNPRFAKVGREGLESDFIFELKLLADLGLVGLPNAGKSTLLRAISNARPRVGHWEFTTLQPTIGTIPTSIDKPPFTVADIPGIIHGASENKGMGISFLRHIERSGGLVFVVALDEKPVEDLKVLLDEMGPQRLENKRILVVATKADLQDSAERFAALKEFVESNNWKVVPCCAMKSENVERVISMMAECAGKV